MDCQNTNPNRFSQNEAYGASVGVYLYHNDKDTLEVTCPEFKHAKVWKNAHIGVVGGDLKANLLLEDITVADNHMGIKMNFVL